MFFVSLGMKLLSVPFVSFAFKQKIMSAAADVAFVTRGYQNCFGKHENSSTHEQAIQEVVTIPATHHDIGDCLSSAEKKENCRCFLKVMGTLKFLPR